MLQTLLQFLDYGDTLDFELRNDGAIHRDTGTKGVSLEDDLVIRAARLLREAAGLAMGVSIALHTACLWAVG